MIDEEVPAALDGERLDRIVALIADISRSDATVLIAAGGASVDGAVAKSGKVRLVEGQQISVDPDALPTVPLPAADASVEFGIVHVDDSVIVVDKPAGLVVHPGAGNADGTLVNGLLAKFPEIQGVGEPIRPGIVHRLDAGSSGSARRRPHAGRGRRTHRAVRRPQCHATVRGARVGCSRRAARHHRRSHRP